MFILCVTENFRDNTGVFHYDSDKPVMAFNSKNIASMVRNSLNTVFGGDGEQRPLHEVFIQEGMEDTVAAIIANNDAVKKLHEIVDFNPYCLTGTPFVVREIPSR